jgi:hypothetical protein
MERKMAKAYTRNIFNRFQIELPKVMMYQCDHLNGYRFKLSITGMQLLTMDPETTRFLQSGKTIPTHAIVVNSSMMACHKGNDKSESPSNTRSIHTEKVDMGRRICPGRKRGCKSSRQATNAGRGKEYDGVCIIQR